MTDVCLAKGSGRDCYAFMLKNSNSQKNLSMPFCSSLQMNSRAKTCYLRTDNESYNTVYLPDCAPVFVGRSVETNIIDTQCSRQQVRLCANYAEYTVTIEQIGTRPCGLNGFKTVKNNRILAKHDDCLEILYGKHPYQIEFNPPPPSDKLQQVSSKKRSYAEAGSSDEDTERMLPLQKIPKPDDSSSSTLGTENDTNTNSNSAINSVRITTKFWEEEPAKGYYIYFSADLESRPRIAAYDMDGTLIKTKSGLVFPKDCTDWQLLYPNIPGKLKQLHADGYKIVIFTNQGAVGTGKVKISDFKQKIETVVQKLGVPIQVFVATSKNIYRKPATGMWDMLVQEKNDGVAVDKENSFYVGDAAGRQKNWALGKKKDHSLADRLMALNIDLRFYTPEEHFQSHKTAPYLLPSFNPKALPKDIDLCNPPRAMLAQDTLEAILMVGCPGSGKSHFVRTHLFKYEHINRDTLGSWQKCVTHMERALANGKSVVIDNTNPDVSSRQRFIQAAKTHNIPIRCFVMATSVEHAKHNNKFRELVDANHVKVSDIIINSYMKNYVPPSLAEGFTEIVSINFVPKFERDHDRFLYEMYLLED